jgi:diaminohydroxyphosphoribosylaminopyrimidine deaminase/5-amino-6-(5-phosphoribosylamino)uracil reductase
MRTGLPLVTLKAALTLDGKIAAPEDNSGWITSERARAHVQEIRHNADAILTGIGTVLADDCLLTDRTGLERSRPLLRIVADSTLRIPLDSRMVSSANRPGGDHHLGRFRRTAPRAGISRSARAGVRRSGRPRRSDQAPGLAGRRTISISHDRIGQQAELGGAGSRIVDKIFFYYAPKILGGLLSLPVAGGAGRLRRTDAIQFRNVRLHSIPPDEFVVEAYVINRSRNKCSPGSSKKSASSRSRARHAHSMPPCLEDIKEGAASR